jgi:hypothetical protein
MGIEDFIVKKCKQTAVYWGDPVEDGYGGMSFGSMYPIEIDCRWENKNEIFKSSNGKEYTSRSIVYITIDLDEQGYLYLGSLDDFESTQDLTNPKIIENAFEIKRFDKSPSLNKVAEFIRKAYL